MPRYSHRYPPLRLASEVRKSFHSVDLWLELEEFDKRKGEAIDWAATSCKPGWTWDVPALLDVKQGDKCLVRFYFPEQHGSDAVRFKLTWH